MEIVVFLPLKKKRKKENFPFWLQEQTGTMTTGMRVNVTGGQGHNELISLGKECVHHILL